MGDRDLQQGAHDRAEKQHGSTSQSDFRHSRQRYWDNACICASITQPPSLFTMRDGPTDRGSRLGECQDHSRRCIIANQPPFSARPLQQPMNSVIVLSICYRASLPICGPTDSLKYPSGQSALHDVPGAPPCSVVTLLWTVFSLALFLHLFLEYSIRPFACCVG